MPGHLVSGISRRHFIRTAVGAGLGLAIAERVLADPLRPLFAATEKRSFFTIRGVVKGKGKGLGNVVVSDGVSVVATDRDGTFSFPADSLSRFVFLSHPSGYDIPVSQFGTAALFKALPPRTSGEFTVEWDLTPSASSDDHHGFLLLADPQMLDAADVASFNAETIPDVIETRKRLGSLPLFGVS